MQCEICGNDSLNCFRVNFEGSELIACEDCAKYGTKIESLSKLNIEKKKSFAERIFPKKVPEKPRERIEYELVADFGKIIRKEREKRELKIDELAKFLYIKASELNRIEAQSLKPNNALIKKIEKELEISIQTKISSDDYEDYSAKESGGKTLSDFIVKKK